MLKTCLTSNHRNGTRKELQQRTASPRIYFKICFEGVGMELNSEGGALCQSVI